MGTGGGGTVGRVGEVRGEVRGLVWLYCWLGIGGGGPLGRDRRFKERLREPCERDELSSVSHG